MFEADQDIKKPPQVVVLEGVKEADFWFTRSY